MNPVGTGRRIERMPVTDSLPVPDRHWSRLARLGALATTVAGGMIAEGARRIAEGKRPRLGDVLLTPSNLRRVADQLSQLRGAAMKVGQLLSMDAGDLLPPELAAILARLRADARPMPMSQVVAVLESNLGADWEREFEQFSFTPAAAASIGQVHRARTRHGRNLAVKIQYPGVRRSIDIDVDNVATLLRISGLLPREFGIEGLLEEAKRQLHAEADYLREGAHLRRFRALLSGDSRFVVPEVSEALTTESVLAMSWQPGTPIEDLAGAPQDERDRVAGLLYTLFFRELFDFGLVQTDPNFANFLYDAPSGRLVLLDFGATRPYSRAIVDAYRNLVIAGSANDRAGIAAAAQAIGYFRADIGADQRRAVVDLFAAACEPLRHDGAFDFARSDLPARIRAAALALGADPRAWHTPPVDAIFLHRKAGGLYLIAARLGARIDVRALARRHVAI